MEALILFALCIVVVVFVGAVCGIVAVSRQGRLTRELAALASRIHHLETRLASTATPERPTAQAAPPVEPPRPVVPAPTMPRVPVSGLPPSRPIAPPDAVPPLPPLPPRAVPVPSAAQRPRREGPSFEVLLGTKWMGWAGALLVLIGAGFFLKWAYDRQIIPPDGRLAIGTLAGVAALGLGEYFRRRAWQPAFQTLTGIGIAVFYLCIYFSLHIYTLTGQTTAFGLAGLVTALAVVMAVAHNALPIAVLGVIGGFLSPIIFSAGGNHPYALFGYVLVVDLVALGAAYFRRWRALDLLCFLGTVALYQGWYVGNYNPAEQLVPALLFATVFYALFLAIPTLYSLTRRLPERLDGLVLLVLNSIFAFYAYYGVLYTDYRHALGFVVVAQAALVFALFRLWQVRIDRDSQTARSLLIIALALVTIAIPIQLRLYGVPIAWAAEGAVFIWLGTRYREPLVKLGGAAALVLAAGGLFSRLPLHSLAFTPVLNVPFASWAAVIAGATLSGWILYRSVNAAPEPDGAKASPWTMADPYLAPFAFLLGLLLACVVLSIEVAQFWPLVHPIEHWPSYQSDSLVLLWTLIPAAALLVVYRQRMTSWIPVAGACFLIGALFFLWSLTSYNHPTPILAINPGFLSRALFIASVFGAARMVRRLGLPEPVAVAVDVAGNALLAILTAFEFARWSSHTTVVGDRMGQALISAAWAVQAFLLIWLGLVLRKQPLRWLGILLFALTAAKVLLVDTAQLEQIYRIVSLMATGVLLLAAMWAYHRYGAILLGEREEESQS